ICDPAIGSGAFPMGLLQEIFTAKQTLWHFEHGNLKDFPASEVKLNIIQNSIYGVDIEKGAVDIARLRFWLSLVVDEDEPKPLPNLDYKIVVGNSLVSKLDDTTIEIDWSLDETAHGLFGADLAKQKSQLLKQISNEQKEFFSLDSNKKKLSADIRNLKIDLLINQLELMVKTKGLDTKPTGTGKKLAEQTELYWQTLGWKNSILQLKQLKDQPDKSLNFFDWKLDFPEVLNEWINHNPGFDIVIGNPPYIQLQKDGGKLANEYEKQGYQTFERTGDIYSLFYEKGIQLLKTQGHLTYITSNKWMRAGYGKTTRQFFLQYNPKKLIDLGSGIFESATVDTNILLIQKTPNQNQLQAVDLSKSKQLEQLNHLPYFTLRNLTADSWTISSDIEQRIKAKIEAKGKPLKEWDIQIYRGILTGYNEAFIIDGKKRAELIAQDPRSAEIIKPLLRGRDIKRYHADWQDLWLINTHNGVKELGIPRINVEKDYPAIYQHLLQFKDKLVKRQDQGDHWTNLRNCAYIQEFEKEIVCWKAVGKNLTFCLWGKGNFLTAPASFLSSNTQITTRYLLGMLQSSFSKYFVSKNSDTTGAGDIMLNIQSIEKLFIPEISDENQLPIVELVDKILTLKSEGKDTSELEKQIDQLVYKLYDLTEEEIAFIENSFKNDE
ncbi:MAG: Eco57I restriction-modification methylase domain-containing protein, partial [Bernardetiaceae bacterium]|nr:Eco57I restriction-modification methylase domain-containing protein [Bernardetiaceae bacterium]